MSGMISVMVTHLIANLLYLLGNGDRTIVPLATEPLLNAPALVPQWGALQLPVGSGWPRPIAATRAPSKTRLEIYFLTREWPSMEVVGLFCACARLGGNLRLREETARRTGPPEASLNPEVPHLSAQEGQF